MDLIMYLATAGYQLCSKNGGGRSKNQMYVKSKSTVRKILNIMQRISTVFKIFLGISSNSVTKATSILGVCVMIFLEENSDRETDLRKKAVLSPINRPARVVMESGPISKRYTLTLMTSLSDINPFPVLFSLREETNTADAFLEFVTFAIERHYLVDGDYLVIDNAPIHTATDELAVLVNLLETYNIRLIFLPTYSPELNPCELCFSFIKRTIRERSNPRNDGFDTEIVKTCLKITPDNVFNFYTKAIIDALFTQ